MGLAPWRLTQTRSSNSVRKHKVSVSDFFFGTNNVTTTPVCSSVVALSTCIQQILVMKINIKLVKDENDFQKYILKFQFKIFY